MGDLFKKEKKALNNLVKEAVRETLYIAANQLIVKAPVWFAEYIDSIKLTFGGPPPPPPQVMGLIFDDMKVDEMGAKHAAYNDLRRDINAMMDTLAVDPFTRISIYSDSDHQMFVEYIGWEKYNRPPYYVFTETGQELEAALAQAAVDKAERKFNEL